MEEKFKKCVDVLQFAYAPYSKFRVSCILEGEDGRIFSGVNVENISYGLTICAERNAVCKAISEGCKRFKTIVIACDDPNVKITPCGACRQVLAEFSPNLEIYSISLKSSKSSKSTGEFVLNEPITRLKELLPSCFDGFGEQNTKSQ